ncbi:MAG: hypothetical protein KC609_11830 [Myxococcales bacterium]|nr:hypothetical protein [Myxococcales bacterium]
MFVDLHLHSNLDQERASDVTAILKRLHATGLEGACFLGLNGWADEDAYQPHRSDSIQLFFGGEFVTQMGHLIVIPRALSDLPPQQLDRFRSDRRFDADKLVSVARDAGAAVIAVHPFYRGVEVVSVDRVFRLGEITAIETVNAGTLPVQNDFAHEIATLRQLPMTAGSDVGDDLFRLGRVATAFAGHHESQASLVAALLDGEMWPIEITTEENLRREQRENEEVGRRAFRAGDSDSRRGERDHRRRDRDDRGGGDRRGRAGGDRGGRRRDDRPSRPRDDRAGRSTRDRDGRAPDDRRSRDGARTEPDGNRREPDGNRREPDGNRREPGDRDG